MGSKHLPLPGAPAEEMVSAALFHKDLVRSPKPDVLSRDINTAVLPTEVPSPSVASPCSPCGHKKDEVAQRVTRALFNTKRQEQGKTCRQKLAIFVEGTRFECVIGMLIIVNGLVMAIEAQHSGLQMGYELQYQWYTADSWPGVSGVLKGINVFFGIIFSAEVIIKVFAQGGRFFQSGWSLFDFFIVTCWYVELWSATAEKKTLLNNSTVFRVARLARLMRLVRVVRQIRSFDALFLMTTAIRSSIIVLAWSCMLLFMIQMLVAFFINQILHWDFFGDERYDIEDRRKVFEYFGTFSRSMLSTFEMTLANWPTVTRVVVENYSEWFAPVFVLHKLTVGFAVIGIINGVFIQETFRVAANDDFIMMHQKEWSQKTHRKKMQRLFLAGDASGDGQLDKKEFLVLMKNPEVKMWLASMGLEAADGEALFEFMDKDKNNNIDAAELVEGVSRLKGSARSLDLLMCLHRQQEMFQALQDVLPELQHRYKEHVGPEFTSRFHPSTSPARATRDPDPPDGVLR
mmetsp:Transcript_23047/g.64332  ORF Transcript_23047/g.64332 Transcript_23047/m.64332 type:complete len:516 (+) Transcript_23047:2-1549(+)